MNKATNRGSALLLLFFEEKKRWFCYFRYKNELSSGILESSYHRLISYDIWDAADVNVLLCLTLFWQLDILLINSGYFLLFAQKFYGQRHLCRSQFKTVSSSMNSCEPAASWCYSIETLPGLVHDRDICFLETDSQAAKKWSVRLWGAARPRGIPEYRQALLSPEQPCRGTVQQIEYRCSQLTNISV